MGLSCNSEKSRENIPSPSIILSTKGLGTAQLLRLCNECTTLASASWLSSVPTLLGHCKTVSLLTYQPLGTCPCSPPCLYLRVDHFSLSERSSWITPNTTGSSLSHHVCHGPYPPSEILISLFIFLFLVCLHCTVLEQSLPLLLTTVSPMLRLNLGVYQALSKHVLNE